MDEEIRWTLYREAKTMASLGKAFDHVAAARKATTDGMTDDHLSEVNRELTRAWRHCAQALKDCLTVLMAEHDEEYPQ